MKKILFVGNGFDLAHDMATNYNQFLFVIQQWTSLYVEAKKKSVKNTIEVFDRYLKDKSRLDEKNLSEMNDIIKKNSWVKYFKECEAEIDGWIDFEREINPVLELFEFAFSVDWGIGSEGADRIFAVASKKQFDKEKLRLCKLWDKYFWIYGEAIRIRPPFVARQYGILKKKILSSLRNELDEFIRCFELYLYEFVYKKDDVHLLKQISEIKPNYVISLNYTLTEQIYGIEEKDVHHIHGMIRKDLHSGKNNMVLGINEQKKHGFEFIYFVKYFQRLQKASGTRYKAFVDETTVNEFGATVKEPYTLHIYGHSLDITDEDILKYIIGQTDKNEKLLLKADKVIIYYYDDGDYEQKIINLINLYGRINIESCLEQGKIELVRTLNERL